MKDITIKELTKIDDSQNENNSAESSEQETLHHESNGQIENPRLKETPPGGKMASAMDELHHLRRQAYELATNAAKSFDKKEDWNIKDFDLMVSTWVKVAGTQLKMEEGADEIDCLIGELTEKDESLKANSNEGVE